MSAAALEQVSDISIELTERQVSSKSAENASRSAEAPALHESATQRRAASTSILEQAGTHITASQCTSKQKALQETLLLREFLSGPVWLIASGMYTSEFRKFLLCESALGSRLALRVKKDGFKRCS